LIQIPIGLTSRCKKKDTVGTQESVTYYAHAVDLTFAITVSKCQGGTFDYIIALLEHTPGSPTLTFEKLYVMLTRVKMAC
jgi:ATP-dependent exoDNAse (exonuclease V) alpha subunit